MCRVCVCIQRIDEMSEKKGEEEVVCGGGRGGATGGREIHSGTRMQDVSCSLSYSGMYGLMSKMGVPCIMSTPNALVCMFVCVCVCIYVCRCKYVHACLRPKYVYTYVGIYIDLYRFKNVWFDVRNGGFINDVDVDV